MRRPGIVRRSGLAGALVGAVLTGAVLLSPASASQPGCPEKRADGPEAAERLEAAAGRDAGWERAAARLVRFAEERPLCDPARREALRLAARYYGFAGDYERASEVAFRAAEQGRLTGHLSEAAEAFISAGTFALETGNLARAARAARQATLLAESPLLTAAQRIAIRGRAGTLLESAG